VAYGANGAIEPSLATAWTVRDTAEGGQEYTFQLRDGVKFHDGEDWNCEVAKLNFDHVLELSNYHGWYDLPKQIISWICNTGMELVVTTKDTYYPLLQELTLIRPLRMLSPKSFKGTNPRTENSCEGIDDDYLDANDGSGDKITCLGTSSAMGTGPFKYIETMENGDVKFERNTNHWRSTPQVEAIIVKKYSSNAAVMDALLAKNLDAVMGAGVLEPADLETIRTKHWNDYQVFLGPVIQNRIIIMNSIKAPTDDIQVRKVIMHAINKAAIIDKEMAGLAEPVDVMFPKTAPYCAVDLTPRWDYDMEKAQILRCDVNAVKVSDLETELGMKTDELAKEKETAKALEEELAKAKKATAEVSLAACIKVSLFNVIVASMLSLFL
jgi:nickel transport system substrate-binding protein